MMTDVRALTLGNIITRQVTLGLYKKAQYHPATSFQSTELENSDYLALNSMFFFYQTSSSQGTGSCVEEEVERL